MAAQTTPPQPLMQNIARTNSYLKRDETLRALETLSSALDMYKNSSLLIKARVEVEAGLIGCVNELNRQPKIKTFLEELTKSKTSKISYTPGQEEKLAAIIPVITKALHEIENLKQEKTTTSLEERKTKLWEKGVSLIKEGDAPKGKGFLRKFADEFGSEQGILTKVGVLLFENKFYFEAMEFLLQAIEEFPKDSAPYATMVNCYITVNEKEKAIELYKQHMKQFGPHARTLINLANLYLQCGKRDKAYEAAVQANSLDPKSEEAKAIMDKLT